MNKQSLGEFSHKYEREILYGLLTISILFMLIKQYVYIEIFTLSIIAVITLLKVQSNFIDFYYKQIVATILSVIISLGIMTYLFYDTYNFLYLTKGYIECVVLELSDYSLLTVSAADDNDGKYTTNKSIHIVNSNSAKDFYERYMMKNQTTLAKEFMLIERITGQIEDYKQLSNNEYLIELTKGGAMFVSINRYSKFTIFKFSVNT